MSRSRAALPAPTKLVSDDQVRALLDRYQCPVPFHAVRTRFLGNIASPVMGLWNRLTRHQDRNAPFRLTRIKVPATREGLAGIARIRREEVIGFIQGLFGKEQGLALPERARGALEALAEAGGLFTGVYQVAGDPTKPAAAADIAQTRRHIRELTQVCEREIHEAVLSCTRGRRRGLDLMLPTTKPTLH
jgi:hypothetical protein